MTKQHFTSKNLITDSDQVARELLLAWIVTMPDQTTATIEARKILSDQSIEFTHLPQDVKDTFMELLLQVAENIPFVARRSRRRNLN